MNDREYLVKLRKFLEDQTQNDDNDDYNNNGETIGNFAKLLIENIDKHLSEHPVRETKEPNQPLACYDCGLPYKDKAFVDIYIPSDIWNKISPKPNGGGVLCFNCTTRRLNEKGYLNVPVALQTNLYQPAYTVRDANTLELKIFSWNGEHWIKSSDLE